MSNPLLKLCPFCGGAAVRFDPVSVRYARTRVTHKGYNVKCDGCGATHDCGLEALPAPTKEAAAEVWNKRAGDETYTDVDGNVWTRPTAEAYAIVCKNLDARPTAEDVTQATVRGWTAEDWCELFERAPEVATLVRSQLNAAALPHLKRAVQLNNSMQSRVKFGGPVWHEHESIDDALDSAFTALGD